MRILTFPIFDLRDVRTEVAQGAGARCRMSRFRRSFNLSSLPVPYRLVGTFDQYLRASPLGPKIAA
jgi:hypothetical protein